MRAFRFRAWHDGQMRSVYALGFSENDVRTNYLSDDTSGVILMQYTGLKDRHGKEIYENDVVIWDSGQYTVKFSDAEGSWILKDDRDDWECPSLYGVSSPKQSRLVVIGNVYETPKLAEVQS